MEKFIENKSLLEDLKKLIASTKEQVAVSVNSSLTLMYWQIGFKINEDILKNSRAEYGKEILQTVSAKLTAEFGQGYSYSSLTRMMKFAQYFTFENIATLSQQLSWSHFKELLPMEDNLKIEFYAQMSSLDKWSVRTLRNRINSMLFERTALSKKPDELITYEIEKLKEGVVSPNSDKNQEQIELLELEKSDIHVVKYLTILPPKEEFEKRLHKAIENAKQKYKIKD